jgi:hypothetical protein
MPYGSRNVVSDTNGSVIDSLYQTPDVGGIRQMQQNVTSRIGQALGVPDIMSAITGGMTPEEAQMFVLGSVPMLLAPEAKVLEEVAGPIEQAIGSIVKQQKPGRWPTYLATKASGETQVFKDPVKAQQWATPPEVMRPDPPTSSMEIPPWEEPMQDVFHGTKKAGFEKFKLPDPAEEFMIDRAIGVHVAKDPAISETFTNVRGDFGIEPTQQGGIYPLQIPEDAKFLEVDQPHLPYVAGGVPSEQAKVPKTPGNVYTDQTQIGNLVYKTAFQKDPNLFARFLQGRRSGLTDTEAKEMARDILAGKSVNIGYRDVQGIDDYFKSEGGINLFGDQFKKDRRLAVKLFHDEMKKQGYVGLKYINTSPMETEKATDPTSYVIFNPQTVRNKLTGATMMIPAAIGVGAAAGSPDKAEAKGSQKEQKGPMPEGDDYDFEAAKAAGVKPDARGHMPDTYKKPNHITFSDESIYNDGGAGHWEQIDKHWYFTPGPTNLKNYSMEELRRYFKNHEPDATLVEPQQSGEVVPMKRKPLDLTDPKQLDEYKKMMTRDTLSRALGGRAPVLPMTPKNE